MKDDIIFYVVVVVIIFSKGEKDLVYMYFLFFILGIYYF